MTWRTGHALLAGAILSCASVPTVAAPQNLFTKVADIPLGEKTSRFDYLSFDSSSGLLYISKMGSAKLLIFDTRRSMLVSEMDGFPKVTGVLAVPELHRVYASVPGAGLGASLSVGLGMASLSSGHGGVAILDTQSSKEIARLPGGVFPDGIAYDPDDKRIFVSDELGGAVEVIDVTTDKVIARIAAGGEVGNVQYDPATGMIYAPVQSHNQMVVIDPKTAQVSAHFALPGGEHPHGLRIARGAAIGYVACDGDDHLLVVDLRARKVLGVLPLGHDPDVLADDPGLKRLYVASESGSLSVFDVAIPTMPRKLADVPVGPNAHSLAVDPATHRLYLPLRDLDGKAAIRILKPVTRP